jgi:membrane-associated PAP2 superfamily phosphatase
MSTPPQSDPVRALRTDWIVAAIGLVLLLAWESSGLDLVLTRHYGSASGFAWRDAWLTRALLHDGGRAVAGVLIALLLADAWQPLLRGPSRSERFFWVSMTLLCLLLVPTLKRVADSSCPWDLAEFGGVAHYVPHWKLGERDGGPGHCFPSGHAVAAFALLAPAFAWRGHRPRLARGWLLAVCAAGLLFGWAQLARGAHFASHTLWSAWLCWVVCVSASHWRARRLSPRWVSASNPAA